MNGNTRGYAAYKVGSNVTSHEAWGLVSTATGVRFHHMVTVSLGGTGTISHVINNTGGPSNSGSNVANLVNYP
ncbi:hypothetical protein [Streptomyces malaysiensis]|uniref:hypothetical protein n=1 Tax=Streptomyces malaysiensis TaxID=92644 RepID=UPI0026ABAF78